MVSTSAGLRYHIGTSTVHYWGDRRAAVPFRSATGALPVLYRRKRSYTGVLPNSDVVPLLAPVAHRQKILSMFKNFYRRPPLLILSPMFCRCPADVLPMCYRAYRCDTVARPYQYRSPKIDKFVLRYCSGEPDRLGVTGPLYGMKQSARVEYMSCSLMVPTYPHICMIWNLEFNSSLRR